MDTDTAMTIAEAIVELNRRADLIRELEAERDRLYGEQMGAADWVQRSRDLEKENQRLREAIEAAQGIFGSAAHASQIDMQGWRNAAVGMHAALQFALEGE